MIERRSSICLSVLAFAVGISAYVGPSGAQEVRLEERAAIEAAASRYFADSLARHNPRGVTPSFARLRTSGNDADVFLIVDLPDTRQNTVWSHRRRYALKLARTNGEWRVERAHGPVIDSVLKPAAASAPPLL